VTNELVNQDAYYLLSQELRAKSCNCRDTANYSCLMHGLLSRPEFSWLSGHRAIRGSEDMTHLCGRPPETKTHRVCIASQSEQDNVVWCQLKSNCLRNPEEHA